MIPKSNRFEGGKKVNPDKKGKIDENVAENWWWVISSKVEFAKKLSFALRPIFCHLLNIFCCSLFPAFWIPWNDSFLSGSHSRCQIKRCLSKLMKVGLGHISMTLNVTDYWRCPSALLLPREHNYFYHIPLKMSAECKGARQVLVK